MKRIYFLLPRILRGPQPQDLRFSFELVAWLKERGINDADIHNQMIDGGQRILLYFDLHEQHLTGLIRDYKEKFLPENREHLEGQPLPEISAITVEHY
ncbi:MAG: hypothetical protein V4469_03805 [Patescibacteria group bacterium]